MIRHKGETKKTSEKLLNRIEAMTTTTSHARAELSFGSIKVNVVRMSVTRGDSKFRAGKFQLNKNLKKMYFL